jgi:hypothetical protein
MTIDSVNKAQYKSWWLGYLILLGLFIIFIAIFMEVKAANELETARKTLLKSEETAIRHYFQALNWYAPWGSSQTAAEELRDLGLSLNKEGKRVLAYQAFLRLRGALYAARSFYTPRRDILETANVFLAGYLSDMKLSVNNGRGNREELYAEYLRIYSADVNFSEFYGFLVVLTFLGWVLSFIKILYSFFGTIDKNHFKILLLRSKIPIFLFIACYLGWILSMKAA